MSTLIDPKTAAATVVGVVAVAAPFLGLKAPDVVQQASWTDVLSSLISLVALLSAAFGRPLFKTDPNAGGQGHGA